MANPLYGFSLYKSPTVNANQEYPVIGTNSVAFTAGDPVIMSGGFAAIPVNSTTPILGIAAKTVTMSSTNQTVAKVTVPIIDIDQSYTFLAGADGELSLTTNPGLFFQLAVVSGGQVTPTGQFLGVIASSAAELRFATTTPGLLCVGVDPFQEGTTGVGGGSRKGLFRFVRSANQPGNVT